MKTTTHKLKLECISDDGSTFELVISASGTLGYLDVTAKAPPRRLGVLLNDNDMRHLRNYLAARVR